MTCAKPKQNSRDMHSAGQYHPIIADMPIDDG